MTAAGRSILYLRQHWSNDEMVCGWRALALLIMRMWYTRMLCKHS